mmetsp:Transcript_15585/g.26409  ORF Transcript_15585/g.26409 Transcript_15585/m.26409 type:complete len:93 (+) Transcript_15585:137-415(+)
MFTCLEPIHRRKPPSLLSVMYEFASEAFGQLIATATFDDTINRYLTELDCWDDFIIPITTGSKLTTPVKRWITRTLQSGFWAQWTHDEQRAD